MIRTIDFRRIEQQSEKLSADVIELKRQQEALQLSEDRLQLQFDRMPIACIVWDIEFRVTSWNPAAEKIFGFSAEEAFGRHPFTFIVPEKVKEPFGKIWSRLLEGDPTAHSINENLTKDGRTIVCEWSNTPLKEAEGKVIGVLSMVQDITERQRAEEALSASEERYRSLFDRIPVALYRTSPQGQIQDANLALVQLLGYPDRESLLGVNAAWFFVNPEDRNKENDLIDQEGMVRGIQLQLQRYDGSQIWVRDTARSVRAPDGGEIYFEGSLEDITEQVQAEKQIRLNTARSQALIEISDLIVEIGLDRHSLLDLIARRVAELIGDACFIDLLSEDGDKLQLAAIFHSRAEAVDVIREMVSSSQIRVGKGLLGLVVQTGQPILLEVVPQDEIKSVIRPDLWPYVDRYGVHSILVVPLRAQDHVIGALGISRDHPECPYNNDDQIFLQEIADRTALALANAQLFEKAQRNLNKVQALRQIDIAITGSVDLRISLGTILDQVMSQTGVDAANVLVLNPHTHNLNYVTGRGFRSTSLQHTHLRLGEGYAGRAALERRTLSIPNLRKLNTDFLRSPSFLAESFVSYFAVPLIVKGQVKGVLEIFTRSPFDPGIEWVDFLEALAGEAAIAIDYASLFDDLQHSNQELILAYDSTIEGWSRALDLRDKETEGHTQRVTEMTMRLARSVGVSEFDLVHMRRGALLHDIGKMAISDTILLKPGPLTEEEWEEMHKHPIYAQQMLAPIPYLRSALDIPYCHHERWDGTGYPRSLKGERYPADRPHLRRGGRGRCAQLEPSLPRRLAEGEGARPHPRRRGQAFRPHGGGRILADLRQRFWVARW